MTTLTELIDGIAPETRQCVEQGGEVTVNPALSIKTITDLAQDDESPDIEFTFEEAVQMVRVTYLIDMDQMGSLIGLISDRVVAALAEGAKKSKVDHRQHRRALLDKAMLMAFALGSYLHRASFLVAAMNGGPAPTFPDASDEGFSEFLRLFSGDGMDIDDLLDTAREELIKSNPTMPEVVATVAAAMIMKLQRDMDEEGGAFKAFDLDGINQLLSETMIMLLFYLRTVERNKSLEDVWVDDDVDDSLEE